MKNHASTSNNQLKKGKGKSSQDSNSELLNATYCNVMISCKIILYGGLIVMHRHVAIEDIGSRPSR